MKDLGAPTTCYSSVIILLMFVVYLGVAGRRHLKGYAALPIIYIYISIPDTCI